jgi:hypothetical protein
MILLLILFTCAAGTGQTRKIAPMPQVQTIGEGQVWRTSDKKDKDGRFIPPWKDVTIANVFGFKKKPVVGNTVTIVPLDVRLAPIDLKIVETKAGVNCDGETNSKNGWWEVELEPITDKRFFEIAPQPNRAEEIPFDVGVIYPSVKSAHQLTRDMLSKNMLPKGINLNIVKAAIDLTNDEIPDVLLVEYCCLNPKKPAGGACDHTCGKTYKKVRNVWKLVDTSTPC